MVRQATWLLLLALAAPARAAPRIGAGTELPVAVAPGDQLEPVVKGETVAYTDYASQAPHVFTWSQASRSSRAITGGSGSQVTPSLQLDRLVYTDSFFNDNVRAYGLLDQSYTTLDPSPAPQTHPTVSARLAAWEDARNGDLRIFVRDFLLGGSSIDTTGPGTHRLPRADGDLVVYIDETAGGAVKLWQLASGTSVIFSGPSGSADVDALAGVVALSLPATGGPDIAIYGTNGKNKALLQLDGEQRNPRVSGDWVAFEDLATGVSRVVLWNWRTDDLLIPAVGSSEQRLGSIDWPRVVYADNRSGNFDIFLYDDSATMPPTDGGPADGGAADGGVDAGPGGGCQDHDEGDDCSDDDDDDCDCEHHHHQPHHDHHRHRPHRHRCHRPDVREPEPHGGDGGRRMHCDDPSIRVLAELQVPGDLGPGADSAEFEVAKDEPAVICIDAEQVRSAWVEVNRRVVATPNDFDPNVIRVEARCQVRAGWNRLGGIVAGKPGSWLRVRVAVDGRNGADVEQDDGTGRTGPVPAPPSTVGCASSGAGLALPVLVLLVLALVAGRRRPR